MHAFIRRFLMHYGIYRRYPLGRFPALRNAWRAAQPWREPSGRALWHGGCAEDALMREVVGFIQLACALTLGMAGGWAVHQTGVVMGWTWF
jgi:hypothetical protein